MRVSKKLLEKLIVEELTQQMEEGFLDKIKGKFAPQKIIDSLKKQGYPVKMVDDPSGENKYLIDLDPSAVEYPEVSQISLADWIKKFRKTMSELTGTSEFRSIPGGIWSDRIGGAMDAFKFLDRLFSQPGEWLAKLPKNNGSLKQIMTKVVSIYGSKYPGGWEAAVNDSSRGSFEKQLYAKKAAERDEQNKEARKAGKLWRNQIDNLAMSYVQGGESKMNSDNSDVVPDTGTKEYEEMLGAVRTRAREKGKIAENTIQESLNRINKLAGIKNK